MNKGNTFSFKWIVEAAIEKHNSDFHAKAIRSYSKCLHLMFGHMTGGKAKQISSALQSIKR